MFSTYACYAIHTFVCISIYIFRPTYICIYIYVSVYIYTYIYVNIHIYINVCHIYINMYHIYIYMYIYIHTYIIYIYRSIHAYIMYTYIYKYIYVFTHKHTHTHHLCNTHMNQSKRSETCVRGRGSYFLAMGCKCSIASKSCLAIPPLVLPPDGFALPIHSAHHPTPKDLTYAQVCVVYKVT